jgi:O-antigen biosynthesis protein
MLRFDARVDPRATLSHWQLCLCGTLSLPEMRALEQMDNRICITQVQDSAGWADRANAALRIATGDFIVPVDEGDTLAQDALYRVVREILKHPECDLIFSDEDKIDDRGRRLVPWFKPDWNPALMLSCNAFGRLGAYRRKLVQDLGGFRVALAGAEEHDLVLRCGRATSSNRIRHIPRVLYHRRSTTNAGYQPGRTVGEEDASRSAVADHLAAQGIAAEAHTRVGGLQISYKLAARPQVSIIVATTARPDIAEPCFTSVLERTCYENFEIVILISRSAWHVPERADLLKRLAERRQVRIIDYPDRPFNYSAVNNLGAAQASGDILCFLNDDTEVISRDWLGTLVSRLELPGVAAVGPMLYYPDYTIQHAGVILGLTSVAGYACLGEPRGSRGYFGRAYLEQDVSCVTAACMGIRGDVFRAIGGFDEALPMAYNDVDLCLRLRSAGWRIIWTPAAELLHRESASLGRHDQGERAEQFSRDVALMRKRWAPLLDADPFYNVNLTLERAYRLAFPPRHPHEQSRSGTP